jgi:hypothetical protein
MPAVTQMANRARARFAITFQISEPPGPGEAAKPITVSTEQASAKKIVSRRPDRPSETSTTAIYGTPAATPKGTATSKVRTAPIRATARTRRMLSLIRDAPVIHICDPGVAPEVIAARTRSRPALLRSAEPGSRPGLTSTA